MTARRRRWKLGGASLVASMVRIAGYLTVPATAASGLVSQTFTFTGAVQTFTVPTGICRVSLNVTGGSGGPGFSFSSQLPGGSGATVRGHVPVAPGEVLNIVVGGEGGPGGVGHGGAGGFGGGGGGGGDGGAGGGASSIVDAGAPLLTAGGGGGGTVGLKDAGQGGNAGALGTDAQAGAGSTPGGGGRATGDGGDGSPGVFFLALSTGGGGGVSHGGASTYGGVGGDGLNGLGGGGGASSSGGGLDPPQARPGQPAGPTQIGSGGQGRQNEFGNLGGQGGEGTTGGGDGADSIVGSFDSGGGGGGGGGAGFGGGGAGWEGGGGGGGYGAGGGGFETGGGGGSSWITPGAAGVSSALASTFGDGSVTISYDPVADQCSINGCVIVSSPTPTDHTMCAGDDLSGVDLSNLDLSYADLHGANLAGANLTNTTITGANFSGTILAVSDRTSPANGPTGRTVGWTKPTGYLGGLTGVTGVSLRPCSPAPGSLFPVGATVADCPIRDTGTKTVAAGNFTVTILPVVQPGSGTVTAPTSGTADLHIAVTLNAPSPTTVTVPWTTVQLAGSPTILGIPQASTTDYATSSGTVTFTAGQTTADVVVPVSADTSAPGPEFVTVSFRNPTGAYIGGFYGLAFGIVDPAP